MEIKGILFDKDGTLIDFYEVWGTAAVPALERVLDKYGFDRLDGLEEYVCAGIGIREDGTVDPESALAWKTYDEMGEDMAQSICAFAGRQLLDGKTLAKELEAAFYQEVCVKRQSYPSFTDLRSLLQELENRGIKAGITTSDSYSSTKSCIRKLGIGPWIRFCGTGGMGLPVKPDGRLIRIAAEQWGILPQEIAVVGDTPNDMRFAADGGAVAVGVLSGVGRLEHLEPLADYVIESIDQLLSIPCCSRSIAPQF